MITAGELAALSRALASYEAFSARLRAVADDASFFSLLGTSARMEAIADEAAANVERFRARRDELVQQDPTDHEAIAAYVEAVAHATGTPLVAAMAAEVQATDPARFVAAVASDTADTVAAGLRLGAGTLAIAGLAFLAFHLNRRSA
jgi:hypothetical protein